VIDVPRRSSFVLACLALAAVTIDVSHAASAADAVPNGQRTLGRTVVEPVYDAADAGVVAFISTPEHAAVASAPSAAAPLYLPVYPAGAPVGALICPHVPIERCPDHGDAIAGLAQATFPDVYGGVLGHDHLAHLHGTGGFHVALEPIVVLFTTRSAASEHLLTEDAVVAAVARGDAVAVPLAGAILHGAEVPTRVWDLATPIP
jgi:hypothetical protein